MSNEKHISFNNAADRSLVAGQAMDDPEILSALVESLSSDQRRIRQFSAAALKELASTHAPMLLPYVPAIVDGLHRPEAQTRWECLETLAHLAPLDPSGLEGVIEGAETSLFDEESGMAHLAAIRFLSAYGARDAERAAQVWLLIEEGIQVYHGDPEFVDMLIAVKYFASGALGAEVRGRLRARMEFDAKNYTGSIGRLAAEIVELCKAEP